MKNSLLFDFTVNKSTNTVEVKREFEANQALVWDAFTKQEILDMWWAPKRWISRTKRMNFEIGGRRFYAMCSPEGQEHWSTEDYIAITPKTNFKLISAFSDKDETLNPNIASSEWNLDFSELNGITTVSISIKHKSLAEIEKHLEMGFQGGFTMTLNYLDQLLTKLQEK